MNHSYGLQLYSVRDITSKDLSGALKAVKELGYDSVEFAGFFGNSADNVKAMLDSYGLTCAGTHTGSGELAPDVIAETVKYHKTIGNTRLIIPGEDLSTIEKIEGFASRIRYAMPILKGEGITLGYHNHSGEFELKPWGSTIHSELEKRTELAFQLDTYWAFNAGCDPIQTMIRLKDRLCSIHLKDGFMGGKGMALGEGEAPVRQVRDLACEMGLPIVVESETLTPDGISEVGRCIDYLKSID